MPAHLVLDLGFAYEIPRNMNRLFKLFDHLYEILSESKVNAIIFTDLVQQKVLTIDSISIKFFCRFFKSLSVKHGVISSTFLSLICCAVY